MQQSNIVKISDNTSNPAPLGLAGFGLTTMLLNIHNAGIFPLDTMIIAMGVFYGGLAQVIVGMMEWKKNNTFGTVAFSSYGFFWLSLVAIWVVPAMGVVEKPTGISMAYYLGVWGIFTVFLFIATFKLNRALQIVFGLVVLLFFFLVMANATGVHAYHVIAGYVGIVCGAAALYTGMAQVVNEVYGRIVMPLHPAK
jgi:uncharacterized protein